MTPSLEQSGLAIFLVFCRVGGCMILAPGFSSPRIPVQFRVILALALSLCLVSFADSPVNHAATTLDASDKLEVIASETVVGAVIGLMARTFVLACQFSATAAAAAIGLAGIPGVAIDEGESGSPLASLAGIAAVMLIFSLNLHIELIEALLDSYQVIPVKGEIDVSWSLAILSRILYETSLLALKLASPFLAYGVVANLVVGLANRFSPQLSIYHAMTGVIMLGGLFIMWLSVGDWLRIFGDSYGTWLQAGGL